MLRSKGPTWREYHPTFDDSPNFPQLLGFGNCGVDMLRLMDNTQVRLCLEEEPKTNSRLFLPIHNEAILIRKDSLRCLRILRPPPSDQSILAGIPGRSIHHSPPTSHNGEHFHTFCTCLRPGSQSFLYSQ